MILHGIYPVGTTIEWDYVEDFGRSTGTKQGIIEAHEVSSTFILEKDGTITLISYPRYQTKLINGFRDYCSIESPNIRIIKVN